MFHSPTHITHVAGRPILKLNGFKFTHFRACAWSALESVYQKPSVGPRSGLAKKAFLREEWVKVDKLNLKTMF